jgi:hypothetical protein
MMMNDIVSARPMLHALTQGDLMRHVMGRFVQIMALLVGVALLISWIGIWTMIVSLSSWAALALTVTQVILLIAFIKIVQVIYARGEDIRNLEESEFTMMAIFAALLRLPGEVALVFFGLFSFAAAVLTWAGASHVVALFGVPVIGAHAAIAGMAAFITCWIIGFASLVTFSLMAELTSAIFSIAHDLRCTRRALEGDMQSAAQKPPAPAMPMAAHAQAA